MDIPALLDAKGIAYESRGGAELAIVCPAQANHSDGMDSKPSFNINLEKEVGHCLACGFKLGQVGMQKWLLGDTLDEEQMQCLSLRSRLKKLKVEEDDLFIKEAELETYMPPGTHWDREYRGISVDTYRKLGAIFCSRGRYQNRICFPIYQHGRLLGVDARALGDEKPKYLRPKGCSAGDWLFPFDLAKQHKVKFVVLCEGIFHAIRWYNEFKIPNALCYFGSNNYTAHCTLLLLELGLEYVLVWPDNDVAGIKAQNTICKELSVWFDVFTIPTEILPEGRDLGDFSREETEGYLEQKVRWR